MKADKKKLNECFLWIVLFLICTVITIFYMAKDNREIPGTDTKEQPSVTEEIMEQEEGQIPSGTITSQ
ncbi:MAG: hypothetical protein J6B50_12740 [Lachnospiraceae bacterium]|nr:hypothetical protein [Lachnospiraceae bacterium]